MQNFNLELFSRLFFLNLSNTIKFDENFSVIPGQASPSASTLEPPTPPRTPIQNQRNHTLEKNYNNNNDDAKENFEHQSSSRNTPVKSSAKTLKCENESDYEEYSKRLSQFNDDSNNFSDDEQRLGGRQSVTSISMHINGNADDSEHEVESDYASSFDSSKLSLKNVESLLDKSSPVVSRTTNCCLYILISPLFFENG